MHQIRTSAALSSTPTDQRVPVVPESPFDAIRRVRPDGSEYWDGREYMPLLGYSKWANFTEAVDQARGVIAAEQGEQITRAEVAATSKITKNARGQNRTVPTFELSRNACYLTAMRGDSRKEEIRNALLYFAAKTREAELAQQETARPKTGAELVLQMAQELVAQEQRLASVEQAHAATAAKVAAIEGRHDWFTALGYARLHGHPTDRRYLQRVGKHATALLRAQGDEPQPRQDATFGAVNTYPVSVLERVFAEVAR